jgi:hypothetical protein
MQAGLEVMFGDRPRIAHNKTIIIDPDGPDPVVETGKLQFQLQRRASERRERPARKRRSRFGGSL